MSFVALSVTIIHTGGQEKVS